MASYTQAIAEIAGLSGTSWVNASSVLFVPDIEPSDVVEVMAVNISDASTKVVGVRDYNSGLTRQLTLGEAEDGGGTVARFLVTSDSVLNSFEIYDPVDAGIKYYIVGYWRGVTFTEQWEQLVTDRNGDDQWLSVNIGLDLQNDSVHLITIVNDDSGKNQYGGVRAYGSILTRTVDIMEAEGGGVQTTSMYVQTDASGRIEVWSDQYDDVYWYNQGYFNTEITFTEDFQTTNNAGEWADVDLFTDHGVPKGRVVDYTCAWQGTGTEGYAGVRTNDTAIDRTFLLREAEGLGWSAYGMSVQTDADGIIDQYATNTYQYMGYFNVGEVGGTAYQEALDELAAAGANLSDTISVEQTLLKTLEELGEAGLELEEDFRQHMPVFALEEISTLVDTMERASSIIKENGLNLVPILDQHMPTYTIKEISTLADTMTKDLTLIRLFEEGGDGVNLSDSIYQHMPVFALEEIATLLDVVESTKLFTKLFEELANLEHFFYQHLPTYTISEIATLADVYSKDWTIVRE